MRIHLEITGKCNLKCVYCYNACFNKQEAIKNNLTIRDWKKIIDEANKLKCERFTISGGEPLLVDELYNLLNRCEAPTILFTNATLLTLERLKKLKEIKSFIAFRISLDGLKAHDKYRIPSSSYQVIKNIELIKKNSNIPIGITTQLSKDLINEFVDFYKIIRDLEIEHWRIDIPFFSGGYVENEGLFNQADFEEIVLACKEVIKKFKKDGKPFSFLIANIFNSDLVIEDKLKKLIDHPCCITDIIAIRPNGNISVCPAYQYFLSNVKEEGSLETAIKKAHNNKFYKMKVRDIKACLNCRYLKLCSTGCRADASFLRGSNKEVDPVNCSLYPLLEKYVFQLYSNEQQKHFNSLIISNGEYPETFKNLTEIIKH